MTPLPRLRVREIHGMRRFLYPFTATVELPEDLDISQLALQTSDGEGVPASIRRRTGAQCDIDFALSIDPNGAVELVLVEGTPAAIPDPLQIKDASMQTGLNSVQQRLMLEVDAASMLSRVCYDGVEHLRGPVRILRKGSPSLPKVANLAKAGPINAARGALSEYPDGAMAATLAEITACKSWVTMNHFLDSSPSEELSFVLPFKATSPTLLCDFGAGGGIYSKFTRDTTPSIELTIDPMLNWQLANGDRVDYRGALTRKKQPYLPGYHGLDAAWFHVVDSDKSIAVAITEAPVDTEQITIAIHSTGDIAVTFVERPGQRPERRYRICYHFLNDVPPVAAATCPQSIMLRPVVETVG